MVWGLGKSRSDLSVSAGCWKRYADNPKNKGSGRGEKARGKGDGCMYKDLLPIGSVVLLKGGEKRIMICGRIQAKSGDDTIYDYSACYYPQGIVDASNMFFFNRDAIAQVFFIGFQDGEELAFRHDVLDRLGELEIRGGSIVPKEDTLG